MVDVYLQLQKHKDDDLSVLLEVCQAAPCSTHRTVININMSIKHHLFNHLMTPVELTCTYLHTTWFYFTLYV